MHHSGASYRQIARKLRLDSHQVRGAIYLLQRCRPIPPPERLALVAMLDAGLDDEDIAEMFGWTKEWSASVRANANQIREVWPIRQYLEEMRGWHEPSDPTPEEIRQECQRFLRERPREKVGDAVRAMEVAWDGWEFHQIKPTS